MNSQIIKQLIVPYACISVLLFYVLYLGLEGGTLIMLLNALFVGTMISISVAYGAVLVPAIIGMKQYDDVRVLAFGILGSWFAYGIVVFSSIYVRSADLPTSTLIMTAVGRYIAINAAIVQVIAPDFNQDRNWLYGRDRKLLAIGLGAGVVFTIFTYVLQADSWFAKVP